jgi:hypothetical protein
VIEILRLEGEDPFSAVKYILEILGDKFKKTNIFLLK